MQTQLVMQHQFGLSILGIKPALKIGIDIDNTLINYDAVFLLGAHELGMIVPSWHGNKNQIREYLRSRDGGEEQWQKLQGQVYGRLITNAHIFDGAYRFLWRCHQLGIIVDLVSHKTEYGHHDESYVPLREVAIEFLKSHGVMTGKKNLLRNICFESTREQKVLRIIENEYDWFIDDLPEVLQDTKLPEKLGKILIDESKQCSAGNIEYCSSWTDVENRLLGEWTEPELLSLAEFVASVPIVSVSWLSRGGNSGLLKVLTGEGEKYALKFYPESATHDRLSSEYNSFKLIREHSLDNVPLPFRRDVNLNVAMYEWVEGDVVNRPNSKHIQQALEFLKTLHKLRELPEFLDFQNASAAFMSGSGFEVQLRARVNVLNRFASEYPAMNDYLKNDLLPVIESVVQWSRTEWRIEPGYNEPLPRFKQTLSPSDFGFHNTIERKNGRLEFIDFEYFGWDDPVKLVADFYFHPGMEISPDLKQQWIEGAVKIYGEEILDRLRVAWPLIGLSWCLILLNEYRTDVWSRRCAADADKLGCREEILATQLNRSRELLAKIRKTYSQPLFC